MPGSKTSDETTDWEAVFEGKENGLISLVENARSTAVLRKCVLVVIHALLRRKDDATDKLACERSLEEIIPADADADTKTGVDLEKTRKKIVELLRTIKEIRKKKALDYESRGTEITTAKDDKDVEDVEDVDVDDNAEEAAAERRFFDDTANVFTDLCQMMSGKRSPESPVERELRDILSLVLLFVGIGIVFLVFQNIQILENIWQNTIFHQQP